ncbi:hypothetical protein BS17DRAFT_882004 [Gyrodon lividus]|nr:hypothetical protein BS17DRAFT_882004 [Gyrodon lividus]
MFFYPPPPPLSFRRFLIPVALRTPHLVVRPARGPTLLSERHRHVDELGRNLTCPNLTLLPSLGDRRERDIQLSEGAMPPRHDAGPDWRCPHSRLTRILLSSMTPPWIFGSFQLLGTDILPYPYLLKASSYTPQDILRVLWYATVLTMRITCGRKDMVPKGSADHTHG